MGTTDAPGDAGFLKVRSQPTILARTVSAFCDPLRSGGAGLGGGFGLRGAGLLRGGLGGEVGGGGVEVGRR